MVGRSRLGLVGWTALAVLGASFCYFLLIGVAPLTLMQMIENVDQSASRPASNGKSGGLPALLMGRPRTRPTPGPTPVVAARPAVPRGFPLYALPGDDELPLGFESWPEGDQVDVQPGRASMLRAYSRANAELGADELTLLEVGIQAYDALPLAVDDFQAGAQEWRAREFALAAFPGRLGDDALVGRRDARLDPPPLETVLVYFRVGAVNAVVGWTDRADQPNLVQAEQVARIVESRLRPDGED